MARGQAVLLSSLLLACLAAAVSARGRPAADEFLQCPDSTRFATCAIRGCVLLMSGRTSTLACAKCPNSNAYVLVNEGLRTAKCECAPGYAGKGLDVCKKCPEDTDIAEGGPMRTSVCLMCPEGSMVNEARTGCLCPAGYYRAAAEQPAGYEKIACKPCVARTAFTKKEWHAMESCSSCRSPEVANKNHTGCVAPTDEDAAPPSEGLFGALAGRVGGGSLARAFEEGRQEGEVQRLMHNEARKSGNNPMLSFVERMRNAVTGGERKADAAAAADADDSAVTPKSRRSSSSSSTSPSSSLDKETLDESKAEPEPEPVYIEADKEPEVKPGDRIEFKAPWEAHAQEEDKPESSEPQQLPQEPAPAAKDAPKAAAEPAKQEAPAAAAPAPAAAEKKEGAKDATTSAPSSKDSTSSSSSKKEQEPQKPSAPAKDAAPQALLSSKPSEQPSAAAKQQEPKTDIVIPKLDLVKLNPDLAKEQGLTNPPEPSSDTHKAGGSKSKGTGSPSSPPSLMDMAKRLGEAMGASGAARGPVVPPGYVDPSAMADAGLPPVNNLGGLVNALVQKQISGVDIFDWQEGFLGDRSSNQN